MFYKHDYDTILTRLVTILTRLNRGEAFTLRELSEDLGVSERTARRYLTEYLSSFPIYREKKRHGKWKMATGYKVEKSNDTETQLVLEILERMADSAGGKFSQKANALLSKLKNLDTNPFYTKIDLEDIGDKLGDVTLLQKAIVEKREIVCLYRFEREGRYLDLKPLKIVNYEKFWYLVALDARNDTLKKYYLKHLSQISLKQKRFNPNKKIDTLLENALSVWFDADTAPYRVYLRLDAHAAKYFKRKPLSKTQRFEEIGSDGTAVISVEITDDMEIVPVVKYWLPHIKVLEPERIDRRIKSEIVTYLDL